MMKPVFIAAYHQSKFGKLLGMTVPEIVRNAVEGACREIKVDASALDVGSIGSACNMTLNRQGLLSGLMAGLGAVIMTSWLLSARPDVGNGYELQALTVAVLGGFNIFGGEGTLPGVMMATLIVTMIASGLQLANVNTMWQLAALGIILLVAVAINQAISARNQRHFGIKV